MSVQSFVPRVWNAMLLKNLNNQHVYAKCCNSDYEGDISGFGSSVVINSIGRITTFAYTRNSDITAPEEVDTAGQTLIIDQGRAFNFAVDDVDKRQARGDFMNAAMGEAAWALAEDTDDFLSDLITTGAGNTVTAATVGTGAGESSAYDMAVVMGVALDESNTPEDGRWMVVPPWYEAMLRLDERFSSFGTDANRAILRGSPIGMVNNFTIYKSNNVPVSGSAYTVLAGYKGAVTFAEQMDKTEAFRPERRFSDAVKGLHIYGGKVTRPSNIVKFVATKGSYIG